jgi:predicted nicotinamide N-methyase
VSIRSLRGKRTLELGCGLGLPSIAAARAGGRVLATDWSPDAVRATAANAERNDVEIETLRCAWGEADAIIARAPWQLVIASDVLYERRNVPLVVDAFCRLLSHRGLGLVSDPGRPPAEAFVPACRARGLVIRPAGHVPIQRGDTSAKVKVFEIRKADAEA